ALYVRGEYINGINETTGLDNVALNPVPEPETWAMLLAGLGVVAWARRRQQKV
ncbi:MAG: PEP-CTERM sorting domain-containing protein, partial [Neisseriaceae bacterium]